MELLLAITIMSLVLSVAYSSLRQITRGKQLLDDRRDASLVANALLVRMTRELQLLYTEANAPLLPPPDDLKALRPSNMSLEGIKQNIGDGARADSVTFLALEGGQYIPDGGVHHGIVQITYRVEANPANMGRRDGTYLLIRDETPYIKPPEKAYERTLSFVVTDCLVDLAFSYFDSDNEQWLEEWGAKNARRPPRMIRLSLALQSPQGTIDTYTTAVPIS